MSTAAPFLASAQSRIGSSVIDLAPVFFLAIVALAIFDNLGFHPMAMVAGAPLMFVAYHAYFNYEWSGESPGRRVFDIRIVSGRASSDLSVTQCIARPIVKIVWLISFVPIAAYFRNQWYSVIPVFIDLFLMFSTPWRQSVADLFCRTVVVKTPPPQPHRAPAVPMYSATDAEFGVTPRKP